FALSFFPTLAVLWLRQLSGLVLLCVVGASALASQRRYAWAGVLLALAMLKPQVIGLPAAGLLCWALWRRERWSMPVAFGATMLAQLALSELLLPGWLGAFAQAAGVHHDLNSGTVWLPRMLAGSDLLGALLVVGPLLILLGWCWWRVR